MRDEKKTGFDMRAYKVVTNVDVFGAPVNGVVFRERLRREIVSGN